MDKEVARKFMARLDRLERTAHLRLGEVTATAPLEITLGGSTGTVISPPKLASVTPIVIGDQVAVVVQDHALLVIGVVA